MVTLIICLSISLVSTFLVDTSEINMEINHYNKQEVINRRNSSAKEGKLTK